MRITADDITMNWREQDTNGKKIASEKFTDNIFKLQTFILSLSMHMNR